MRPLSRPAGAALAVFLAGTALAIAASSWLVRRNEELAQARFSALARGVTGQVFERLRTYEYGLRGMRGVVLTAGPEGLSRDRIQVYGQSRDLDDEFPGARGMGIIRRVSAAAEREFVAEVRRDGQPDFSIRQLTPHAGERYVIQYVEPYARNKEAVGLDVASDATRRRAAEQALRTGHATLTGPVTLVQAAGLRARGFLLLLPIYRSGVVPATAEERLREGVGWSYAALVIDEVLVGFDVDGAEFALTLRDLTEAGPTTFFSTEDSHEPSAMRQRIVIPLYGRRWEADVRARATFVERLNQPRPSTLVALGVALAALLSVLTFIYTLSNERAEEVQAEQARRAAIVTTSSDAIIDVTVDGRVVGWNEGAERLFGYSSETAEGRLIVELIVPDGHRAEAERMREAAARGERVGPIESVRRARDGTLVDVSVAASPILATAGGMVGIAIIVRDISDSKRAARRVLELNASLERQVQERTALLATALRDNQALLRTLHLHAVVAVTDPAGCISDVNDRFCRLSGYERAELLGQPLSQLVGRRDSASEWDAVWRTVSAGGHWRGELSNRSKSGGMYWLDSIVAPFVGEEGAIERTILIATDITATKLVEQRLRASEAFLDRAGRIAGVGGWELDVASGVLTWSAETRRIHEVDETYLPTTSGALSFYPPEARATLCTAASAAITHGAGWDLELPFATPTGRKLWVRAVASAELEDGKVVRLVGALQDITERKRVQDALEEVNQRFSIAADSAGIAVWDLDVAAGRMVCDDHMFELYRWEHSLDDPQVLVARSMHPEDKQRIEDAFRSAIRSGDDVDEEFRIIWPSGEVRHLKVNARVTRDASGRALHVTGVNIDISELKRAELELRDATRRAEEASLAKSQFLANMSHEIRTPMNAVIGFSHLLGSTALDARQEALLAKIKSASKSLLAVINDVLDLSKIEAGELMFERAPFSLTSLLKNLTDVAAVQADAKGIRLVLDVADDVPASIEGDLTRLSQVLTNLLSNAVKFTERGEVALRVRKVGERGPDHVRLRFSVHDTGIGIDPEVLPRLFAPFAQADASTTRRFGGSGLGLSIVKRLTELMGGEVGLTSTPGVGSEFWVVLELARVERTMAGASDTPPSAVPEAALAGVCVLVVDEESASGEAVKCTLESEGASVALGTSGGEVLERLRATPLGLDVILVDLDAPRLDGYEIARRIRTELGLGQPPILGLTASAIPSASKRAAEVGMRDLIAKPFDTRDLLRAIRRHCSPHPRSEAPHVGAASVEEPSAPAADDFELLSGLVLLVQQLRQSDVAAVEQLGTLATELRRMLGAQAFESLYDDVHNLRFERAIGVVQGSIDKLHVAEQQLTA